MFFVLLILVVVQAKYAYRQWNLAAQAARIESHNERELIRANYTVNVSIRNRYAITTIEATLSNYAEAAQDYPFAVDLDDDEYISGLKVEILEESSNRILIGKVKDKLQVKTDFEMQNKGKRPLERKYELERNTFSTPISIPAVSLATILLTYESQLEKTLYGYSYKTNIKTYGAYQHTIVHVNINETRDLDSKVVELDNKSDVNELESTQFDFWNEKLDQRLIINYKLQHPVNPGGEMIINNGYALHFMAPYDLPAVEKDILFLIDKSGSMTFDRVLQTKQAIIDILSQMQEEKSYTNFNIATFARGMEFMNERFVRATKSNLEAGQKFMRKLETEGSTYMFKALQNALKRFSVNENSKIILFVSDGEPSDKDWPYIHSIIHDENKELDVILYSFVIGSRAPFEDFERLSLANNGLAFQILDDINMRFVLTEFYQQIAKPIFNDIKCSYTNSKKSICSRSNLFNGQEFVSITEMENCSTVPQLDIGDQSLLNITIYSHECGGGYNQFDIYLEKMFAYMQIQECKKKLKYTKYMDYDLKEEILELSIKYQFLTEYTSMVFVDQDTYLEEINLPPTRRLNFRQQNVSKGRMNSKLIGFHRLPALVNQSLGISYQTSQSRLSLEPTKGRKFKKRLTKLLQRSNIATSRKCLSNNHPTRCCCTVVKENVYTNKCVIDREEVLLFQTDGHRIRDFCIIDRYKFIEIVDLCAEHHKKPIMHVINNNPIECT